jgi:hypothetical protein
MTNKKLLVQYTKERATLLTQRDTIDARISALDGILGGLRVLTGEAPAFKGRHAATGTKALIIDVLADGRRRGATEIAAQIKVNRPACQWHLKELVHAGEVVREGQSRSTTYHIP